MDLLCDMGPPGGGRQVITMRLQTRFNLINMTFPSVRSSLIFASYSGFLMQETQIKRIFGTMINQKMQDFEEDVKPIGNIITQATIEMYSAIQDKFLPTPAKIHYLFNLRDISKVTTSTSQHHLITLHLKIFQGLLRAQKDFHDTKTAMSRLWIHECFRVFSDRLVDSKDRERFMVILNEKLGSLFDQTFHGLCPSRQPPFFGSLINIKFVKKS